MLTLGNKAAPGATTIVKQLVSVSTDGPQDASAEFRVGVRSMPYLADHGFQDMVVLPGSFYVEMALNVDRELSGRVPRIVRNASFDNPVILPDEDVVIRVEVRGLGGPRAEYTFYEVGVREGGGHLASRQRAARLEIDRGPPASPETGAEAFSVEAFQARSHAVIDQEGFYKALRENGNQYGPRFQNVSSIWRAGDQSLARISVVGQPGEPEPHYMHPSLLDSMTQVLASFVLGKGRTFILRSIEKVEVMDFDFPDTLWAHATRLLQGNDDESAFRGNVRVFDQAGRLHLELSGVAFTLLERAEDLDGEAAGNLVVASNFTAEPIEDSLRFWGDHFGVRIQPEFAPYNQVFQQLLDGGSAFRRNSDGANVILLGLEEWALPDRRAPMVLDKERAQQCFGEHARCVLPNGLEIVHLNRYETDYLYKEIFEDQCYLRHGIHLDDGATVVDVGANIGLFSLFVMSRCKNSTIYACEPAPLVYDLLKANGKAYGSNVLALNIGVSDRPKMAMFTFYEKSSVFSGFHSDEAEDGEAIRAVVRNMLNSASIADGSVEEYVNELTADRLLRKTHECRLTSVSALIREHRIDSIDLLKIDAEKSELDIIRGIEECDWPKIRQIVIEIHDRTQKAVKQVERLLVDRGFRCAVEQEALLEHAGLFNIYATRSEAAAGVRADLPAVEAGAIATGKARQAAVTLSRNIEDFSTALRAFMDQSGVPLVLCVCPRTPAVLAGSELGVVLDDAERVLLSEAGQIANVHAIGSASLLQRYPVGEYYDPHTHHAGHIPYTPECYAAIGTALVRTIFNIAKSPFKVIVLDCDNTLWKGVCGEDGPSGIEVTAPHRALQEFAIRQMRAGMLLCLCSKNSEKDVLDVFDQRVDMPLKREHLVSWRVNWSSKSENIRALARELDLALDSFIFIDDNPVECADVRINCPGVLALQLPPDTESFPSFLEHVWAFDHTASTTEDAGRTRMYQENARRRRYREQSFSLKDFVRDLQLRIEIDEAADDQLARISQLTFRTNQFNFTTIRRSEAEIRAFRERAQATCAVVRVSDRFGDYGLVGVLMFEAKADRYEVDTFLLSCRVLGRGVEHVVVSWLARRAVREGVAFLEFRCAPTERNLPALEFMASIGDKPGNAAAPSRILPAERLTRLEYVPDEGATVGQEEPESGAAEKAAPRLALAFHPADWPERLQLIGERLRDATAIAKAIEEFRLRSQPVEATADAIAGDTLEATLANIWRKALGKPRVGLNDNFFEVGGTSLKAVQVIAMVKRELNQSLSIVSLFENPTVALLAARLNAAPGGEVSGASTTAAAALRGRQRRQSAMKRRST